MSRHAHAPVRRFAVVAAPVVALGLLTGPAAMAAGSGGDVDVVNTETVQVKLDADGTVGTERVYEQVALTGKGTVDLDNPISNNRLRNLDGFGGFDVEDGVQKVQATVDGSVRFRTVSNYSKKLPLKVTVRYFLDGRPVSADDVVGKDGELEVRYRVENVTGRSQDVTYTDGQGQEVTEKSDVVVPMVGTLTTTAPSTFTDVTSGEANIAGDGKGGTKLSFTMTLFPPIGSPTAEFGYTAQMSDGQVPAAAISAVPVNPLQSPSFKGGAASYQGGAQTGATLTAGATTIDENLLRLRDGASDLLAGLIQLRDGSGTLAEGLNDRAVPGTRKAADGAGQLADGADQLDSGAARAAAGAEQLDAGAKKLRTGAKALDAGASDIDDGANQLDGGAKTLDRGAQDLDEGAEAVDTGANAVADGLEEAGGKAPALIDGLEQVQAGLGQVDAGLEKLGKDVGAGGAQLSAGIDQLQAGIGSKSANGTLLNGVAQLQGGISGQIVPGLDRILAGIPESRDGLRCASEILVDLASNDAADDLDVGRCPQGAGVSAIPATLSPADPIRAGVLRQVADGLEDGYEGLIRPDGEAPDPNDPTLQEGVGAIRGGLTTQILPGLTRLGCGLDNTSDGACDATKPGLLQGIDLVDAGVSQLTSAVVAGVGDADDTPEDETLRGGVNGLQAGNAAITEGGNLLLSGLTQLSTGAGALATGTGQLADGTGKLADGTGTLVDGTGRLVDGTGRLADGTGTLADGTDTLVDGTGQLADGNGKLADGAKRLGEGAGQLDTGLLTLVDGLVTAGDGALRINEGLGTASDGAPKLVDGAQDLSDQGTKKLVEAGESTAADFGLKYALIEAGAARAGDAMAYGAPEGAEGFTAYSYDLAGADGESTRNAARGGAALAVFALAGGVAILRRRFLA
ncbi:MAG: hypothetical protein Q7T56_11080 [Nocardioidaceae bacterium]|nr:hypothetical protein [Nocardioidaceae bacterium]